MQGPQGQGLQGPQGTQGLQGLQGGGFNQNQGTQGSQGLEGSQGSQGSQGLQGGGFNQLQGLAGSQGLVGSQGFQGFQGVQGIAGTGGGGGGGSGSTKKIVVKIDYDASGNISGTNGSTITPLQGTATVTIVDRTSSNCKLSFNLTEFTQPPSSILIYGYIISSSNTNNTYKMTHLDATFSVDRSIVGGGSS